MQFNSIHFLVFYPIVTALYFALPHRFRWALLLVASCLFYMAFVPAYVLILAFTIAIDYVAGILIERATGPRRRHLLLLSLAANIGVLAFFKYFEFATTNLDAIARAFHLHYPLPTLEILLPIGLSFHTFQSMAYTVEVYRGSVRAERHLGIFALYVMFYPQLVAGPIERPQNLLPQFRAEHAFDYDDMTAGLRRMLWGLFKKVVIADRLAILVNEVFGQPYFYSGLSLVIAMVLFAFQIYCDFSGYSDVALGSAQTMGFRLMTNFDRPYAATSIREFWRRWHISLSTFFRDYVYVSLGGNRVSRVRMYGNLMVTFALSGLWHGARWTFVIWGLLHGAYMIAADLTASAQKRAHDFLGRSALTRALLHVSAIAFTFALVTFAWVFFRASSVDVALSILFRAFGETRGLVGANGTLLGRPRSELVIGAALVVVLYVGESVDRRISVARMLEKLPTPARLFVYAATVVAIMNLGVAEDIPFIYFQF